VSKATNISGLAGAAAATAFNRQTVAASEADFVDLEARFDRIAADKRVWNQRGSSESNQRRGWPEQVRP
jgi:hypothetical protein